MWCSGRPAACSMKVQATPMTREQAGICPKITPRHQNGRSRRDCTSCYTLLSVDDCAQEIVRGERQCIQHDYANTSTCTEHDLSPLPPI